MRDWREFDFFRSDGGLSSSDDSPECAIAYDYELVRDCQLLCARIAACPNRLECAKTWTESMPYRSRWFTNLIPGVVPERPDLEPLIPTACLLAPWFPASWLAGSPDARHAVVRAMERAYATVRPLMLRRYPLSDNTRQMLESVTEGGRYMRAEIVFDRTATPGKVFNQIRKALLEPGLFLSPSSRKRHASAIRSLERLCCHRLGSLPVAERDVAAEGITRLPNGLPRAKLSLSRKSIRADFAARHYILPAGNVST
jgi:hypothetical protein